MYVDIVYLIGPKSAHFKGLAHRHKGSFAVRRGSRLMISIISIGISGKAAIALSSSFLYRTFLFYNNKTGSLTKVEPPAVLIKGTAPFPVKYHQGVEPIEGKTGQGINATHKYCIQVAVVYQPSTMHYSIGSRRACG